MPQKRHEQNGYNYSYRGCRKTAITYLKNELKCKNKMKEIDTNAGMSQRWKVLYYQKESDKMKTNALNQLLIMHCISNGINVCNHQSIPDHDRAALNQAIRSQIPLKYIEMMLIDYPKACESGGVVDHLAHPIHIACKENREIVYHILKNNPECVNQRDEDDVLPFQRFIENQDTIDLSSEAFVITANLFHELSPTVSRKIYSKSRESLKEQLISECVLPSHLHQESLPNAVTSGSTSQEDDKSL